MHIKPCGDEFLLLQGDELGHTRSEAGKLEQYSEDL